MNACSLCLFAAVAIVCSVALSVAAEDPANDLTSYYVTGEPKSGLTWLEELLFASVGVACKAPECKSGVHSASNRSSTFVRASTKEVTVFAHKNSRFLLPGGDGLCKKHNFDFKPPCGLSDRATVDEVQEVRLHRATTNCAPPRWGISDTQPPPGAGPVLRVRDGAGTVVQVQGEGEKGCNIGVGVSLGAHEAALIRRGRADLPIVCV